MDAQASLAESRAARARCRANYLQWILLALLAGTLIEVPPAEAGQDPTGHVLARERMVEQDVRAFGIRDQRVLDALRKVPRHEFVPPSEAANAYFDMALPIGEGQTISPPFVVAYMTQLLDVRPTDKVLEIGTGSGYQAAVLGELAREVYTIEIVGSLGRRAAEMLARLGYSNVRTRIGDGFAGWPEAAPFDRIIVTCSPEDIPQPLVEQLADGGKLIVPVGERFQQTLYLYTKQAGELQAIALAPTMFVSMEGQAEDHRKVLPDATTVKLVNGEFEQDAKFAGQPDGWYYVRQAELIGVQKDDDAIDGHGRWLQFRNTVVGRHAQALQAIGVDGRHVHAIELACRVRGTSLKRGRSADHQPRLEITFYGEDRKVAGSASIGPWLGTSDWLSESLAIDVPNESRLAVVAIGLWGATGELECDDVRVTVLH